MYETHVTTLSSNFSELYFQFDLRFEKDELSDRSKEMLWKTLKGKGKLKPAVFEKAFAKLKTLNFSLSDPSAYRGRFSSETSMLREKTELIFALRNAFD